MQDLLRAQEHFGRSELQEAFRALREAGILSLPARHQASHLEALALATGLPPCRETSVRAVVPKGRSTSAVSSMYEKKTAGSGNSKQWARALERRPPQLLLNLLPKAGSNLLRCSTHILFSSDALRPGEYSEIRQCLIERNTLDRISIEPRQQGSP